MSMRIEKSNWLIVVLIQVFACCISHAPAAWALEAPKPLSDPQGSWLLQPAYSDEFDGKSLDLSKWDNDVVDWGVWSWLPENAWVDSGNLSLRMNYQEHERKGQRLFYTSGIVRSKAAPIKYGYFEARIQAAPKFPGVCPAFWAFRQEADMWTEIDFVELTQRHNTPRQIDIFSLVHRHPDLKPGEKIVEERTVMVDWDPRDAFHVYGVEWNESRLNWYIDGVLVGTSQNLYWHQALDIVLSFGVRRSLRDNPSAQGLPTTALVDYVRVWKNAATPDCRHGSGTNPAP